MRLPNSSIETKALISPCQQMLDKLIEISKTPLKQGRVLTIDLLGNSRPHEMWPQNWGCGNRVGEANANEQS